MFLFSFLTNHGQEFLSVIECFYVQKEAHHSQDTEWDERCFNEAPPSNAYFDLCFV